MSEANCEKLAMSDLETNPQKTASSDENGASEPPLQFAAASQPSYGRTLFFGPDGLRAGWGLVLYLLQLLILLRLTNWLVIDLVQFWPRTSPRIIELIAELASLVAAVVPALVMMRIEKRPWNCYGLPVRRSLGRRFFVGAAWGICSITVLIVALYGMRDFSFGRLALHGFRIAKYAAYWSVMFLLVGLFEEFCLRGYTQFTLTRGIGFWPAALALSAAFGLFHLGNEGEHWTGLLAAAWIGLFFCLTLRRTGSLWFAVGFHAAWDWGETFFYSVPDSGLVAPGHLLSSSLHGSPWLTGGTVGPEGSVLCFVVIALTWIVFDRVYPAKGV